MTPLGWTPTKSTEVRENKSTLHKAPAEFCAGFTVELGRRFPFRLCSGVQKESLLPIADSEVQNWK